MKEVKTTMAGSIWKLNVKQGDVVKIGQEVIILESMKMEIPITSEVDGVIEEVLVKEGDFVNEEDILLKLNNE